KTYSDGGKHHILRANPQSSRKLYNHRATLQSSRKPYNHRTTPRSSRTRCAISLPTTVIHRKFQ
ncbi:MAG: hypothetical protein LAT57_09435, partial [Balneolales bacterium]|nr:hypothetical protein [Balneolales bacterium]